MKNHFHRINVVRSIQLLTFALIATAVSNTALAYNDTNADGSINVGRDAAPVDFTVLTNKNTMVNDPGSFIQGNAGVGASGSGDYNSDNMGQLRGDLYIDKNGHVNVHTNHGATITGVTHQDTDGQTAVNTTLSNAWADATSLYNAAMAEAVTPAYASLTNKDIKLDNGANMTISGGPNQKIVLSIHNFELNHGSTFTLQGTATTSFIVNVKGSFSLDNASMIVLAGVPAANVLFAVAGGDPHLNHQSKMSGILLTLNHKVNLENGSQVKGRVIANEVEIHTGASVVTPMTNP